MAYAEIAADRRRTGRPISQFDAQIAAIVRSRGGLLASRNVRDFVDCGIEAIDPWREGSSGAPRSEEHTSELQSLMRTSYAVFCLKKTKHNINDTNNIQI